MRPGRESNRAFCVLFVGAARESGCNRIVRGAPRVGVQGAEAASVRCGVGWRVVCGGWRGLLPSACCLPLAAAYRSLLSACCHRLAAGRYLSSAVGLRLAAVRRQSPPAAGCGRQLELLSVGVMLDVKAVYENPLEVDQPSGSMAAALSHHPA
jgi:hypothetical protein